MFIVVNFVLGKQIGKRARQTAKLVKEAFTEYFPKKVDVVEDISEEKALKKQLLETKLAVEKQKILTVRCNGVRDYMSSPAFQFLSMEKRAAVTDEYHKLIGIHTITNGNWV